jgi:hypothetical protein
MTMHVRRDQDAIVVRCYRHGVVGLQPGDDAGADRAGLAMLRHVMVSSQCEGMMVLGSTSRRWGYLHGGDKLVQAELALAELRRLATNE